MAVSTVSGTCPGKCKLLPEVEHFSQGFHLGCITISLPNLFLYKLSGLETAILYIDNSLHLLEMCHAQGMVFGKFLLFLKQRRQKLWRSGGANPSQDYASKYSNNGHTL